ncbi:MAG: hypothetical protein ACLUE6_07760 [Acutalibacteraceae bacterium]
MKKSKLVATFVAVLLIVSLCALCLYGCNDEGVGIEGKGVSRPEDIFTNDLDTTDSENLIANAHVTASSADITSSASYKILSADATFDIVKEDYENSRTEE